MAFQDGMNSVTNFVNSLGTTIGNITKPKVTTQNTVKPSLSMVALVLGGVYLLSTILKR